MSNITDEEIEKLADDYVRIHNLFNRTYIRNTFIDGYKAALQNKVSGIKTKNMEPVIGNCSKHPGYNFINCPICAIEGTKVKVSDISAEKWKVFSHTSALGNTGDYMSDCGIENGTISFYCNKPDDITNEELKEICDSLNSSIVNERKDSVGSWVSGEDRLPDVKKDGNKVLLFREMNESQKALSMCIHDTSMIKYCEKSSYWMPLPAPPESQPQQKEVDRERLIF